MATEKHGIKSLQLNGETYSVNSAGTLNIQDFTKTPKPNMTGGGDYVVTAAVPTASFTLSDKSDLSLSVLQDMDNATALITLYNGKQYQFAGAYLSDTIELDITEGNIAVTISAESAQELL